MSTTMPDGLSEFRLFADGTDRVVNQTTGASFVSIQAAVDAAGDEPEAATINGGFRALMGGVNCFTPVGSDD